MGRNPLAGCGALKCCGAQRCDTAAEGEGRATDVCIGPRTRAGSERRAEASGLTDVSAIKRHLATWKREIKEDSKDMVRGTLVAACARVSCSNGQELQQTGKSTGEDIQSISVLLWGFRLW